ncbi:hypothetical protein [Bacillus nitratireducens]|uniref:hypothetical protein n=1 Tax=Bacillus nitratireducens TaxID=2026193 RepID=UPI000A27B47A|nr:hypothetical protein [Bacillus nitratireducens]OSX95250.1 hypothetical protein BTJ45_01562 [Bacillus mycoides]
MTFINFLYEYTYKNLKKIGIIFTITLILLIVIFNNNPYSILGMINKTLGWLYFSFVFPSLYLLLVIETNNTSVINYSLIRFSSRQKYYIYQVLIKIITAFIYVIYLVICTITIGISTKKSFTKLVETDSFWQNPNIMLITIILLAFIGLSAIGVIATVLQLYLNKAIWTFILITVISVIETFFKYNLIVFNRMVIYEKEWTLLLNVANDFLVIICILFGVFILGINKIQTKDYI